MSDNPKMLKIALFMELDEGFQDKKNKKKITTQLKGERYTIPKSVNPESFGDYIINDQTFTL